MKVSVCTCVDPNENQIYLPPKMYVSVSVFTTYQLNYFFSNHLHCTYPNFHTLAFWTAN